MKYVKLFESWLNEEEGEAGKLTKFNASKPQLWPVSKTTIEDLYCESGGRISTKVLESILSRALQKSGEPFNNSPKIGAFSRFSKVGIEKTDEGKLEVKYKGRGGEQLRTLSLKSNIEDQFITDILNGKDEVDIDINSETSNSGLLLLISANKPFDSVVQREGREVSSFSAGSGDGECALIVPFVFSSRGGVDENSSVLSLSVFVGVNGKQYMTRLSNVLLYLNSSDVTSFTEKPGSVADAKTPLGGIFAGEETGAMASYAQTIKMPSGGNLAVGQDNSNGLYKIGTGNIAKYLGQIKFDFDSDKLTEEAKQVLDDDAVSGALAKADKTLIIVGHADGKVGKGGEKYNVDLSMRRAKSVLTYLQTLPWFKKVSAKVTTNGVGSSQPVSPDNKGEDPTASAVNRRVEFLIDVPADTKPDYDAIKKAANLK